MKNIKEILELANHFLDQLETKNGYKLFIRSDCSPYARCFVIFTKSLLKDNLWLDSRKTRLISDLNDDLYDFYNIQLGKTIDIKFDKPFLQLFCFTLSALNILNGSLSKKNLKILEFFLNLKVEELMIARSVNLGLPGSGNYSMFLAVLNIYAQEKLDEDRSLEIKKWLKFNLNSVNDNGFWGNFPKINHLQFQNGYHQYEIFEYLAFHKAPWNQAAKSTLTLADQIGHFSPYPGGGGCYDFDAIFLLTSDFVDDIGQNMILNKSLGTIISEQNKDGGFCESKLLRNHNNWPRLLSLVSHIHSQPSHLKLSSLRIGLNLFRFKHKTVSTHWTSIDRKWNESNAWDTFFRLSAIFRIYSYLGLPEKELFKVNHFPGIG